MRIITWNIWHGGGKRTDAIIERIAGFDPDIVVLTEYRNNGWGEKLVAGLKESGLVHVHTHGAEPKMNSVMLASREPFDLVPIEIPSAEAHRCIVTRFQNVNLVGVYFAIGKKKIPLYEALERFVPDLIESPTLLIGDFNTGRHHLDENKATFVCTDRFEHLETMGLIDAWRSRNPDKRESTWYSSAGNGFRLDHAFACEAFNERIESIEYSHEEREQKLSDHSVLVLEVSE